MRSLLIILFSVLLVVFQTACQSNKYIENTYEMSPKSNWSDQHRKTAKKAYLYAQMSNNSYGQAGDEYDNDGNDFVLPSDWKAQHVGNDELGFAYSIYRKTKDDKLQEVVIAFRGTEGITNFDDVYHGNLLARQNPLAISLYKITRSRLDREEQSGVPIVLTGHSLGGALAIHAAINVPGEVPYYVFNSSPRFNRLGSDQGGGDPDALMRKRHSIVETSEFLYALRFPATEANQIYTPFNCDENFKPFTSHGIEKLAACLTLIASLNNSEAKVEMVKKKNR